MPLCGAHITFEMKNTIKATAMTVYFPIFKTGLDAKLLATSKFSISCLLSLVNFARCFSVQTEVIRRSPLPLFMETLDTSGFENKSSVSICGFKSEIFGFDRSYR